MPVRVIINDKLLGRFIDWLSSIIEWVEEVGLDYYLAYTIARREVGFKPPPSGGGIRVYSDFYIRLDREGGVVTLEGRGGVYDDPPDVLTAREGSIIYYNNRYYIARGGYIEPVHFINELDVDIEDVIENLSPLGYYLSTTVPEFTSLYILAQPILTWP